MRDPLDKLGRRTRLRPKSTGKRVSPTKRDLRWFAALAEHGPLPSSYLLAFTEGSHRSEKRARERLTDLFHESNTPDGGAYLTRPLQQFRTIDSRYNQLVYDLNPASVAALDRAGMFSGRRASGPWLHSHMVTCITASIELACRRTTSHTYIPQSAILARADAALRWPTTVSDPATGTSYTKDLIPDAVFGLEYRTPNGRRFRFFAVEADRGTEPARSSQFHRKSFKRHLLQYAEYVERDGYREHLGLSAPLLVLNITSNSKRLERMKALCIQQYASGNTYQLFQSWESFGAIYKPPETNPDLLRGDWLRASAPPIRIDQID